MTVTIICANCQETKEVTRQHAKFCGAKCRSAYSKKREKGLVPAIDDRIGRDLSMPGGVPDALWPSDNAWDIPMLDLSMQATALELPVAKWGSLARAGLMKGTWHFYCEDYKFNGLWSNPATVVNTRCVAAIEPNFSTNEDMPQAATIWGIYRKRWLSRYWQSQGIRILVDLNVTPGAAELNLAGVPRGWGAFATRGYSDDRLHQLNEQYALAVEIAAGRTPLFVVIGGGEQVQRACKFYGWVYLSGQLALSGQRAA